MEPTQHDLEQPGHFALAAAIFEGSLVFVAVGLGWLLGTPPLDTFRWSWADLGLALVATLPMLVLLWLSLVVPLRPLRRLARFVDRHLVPLFRECGLLELAVIAFLAGLGEEMLFRGVVQAAVDRLVGGWLGPAAGTAAGLGVAAVLFGLAHRVTNTYALLAALISLYLGWIWLATGNLLVPIAVHALYDWIALVYLVELRGRSRLP